MDVLRKLACVKQKIQSNKKFITKYIFQHNEYVAIALALKLHSNTTILFISTRKFCQNELKEKKSHNSGNSNDNIGTRMKGTATLEDFYRQDRMNGSFRSMCLSTLVRWYAHTVRRAHAGATATHSVTLAYDVYEVKPDQKLYRYLCGCEETHEPCRYMRI